MSENKIFPLCVCKEEAGQKLITFLSKHFDASPNSLHKAIRSGQVRVNSARVQAFVRLNEADLIRIPPFFVAKNQNISQKKVDIVYENQDYMIINKASGLACHSGSNHTEDNLTARLHGLSNNFQITLVHRLDKDSSGLLIAAKNYQSLREFQDSLANREQSLIIHKEYLAWVDGLYPLKKDFTLLIDDIPKNRELKEDEEAEIFQEASCYVQAIQHNKNYSLLHILLISGRKHQIRIQMSKRGFPLVGDSKYGSKSQEKLKLHAFRLSINQESYQVLPNWSKDFAVKSLPPNVDWQNLVKHKA